jgi:hypothetical protein
MMVPTLVCALAVAGSTIAAATGPIRLDSGSVHLQVTAIGWDDNASGPNAQDVPANGKRYVAIKLKLVNLAHGVYFDSPGDGGLLLDSANHPYAPVDRGPRPALAPKVRILPRHALIGWMTFEIPRSAHPTKFVFALPTTLGGKPISASWQL